MANTVIAERSSTSRPTVLKDDLVQRDKMPCAPFEYLIDQMRELGSANDAADRGYSDVADGMRNKAFERIRELIDMHPEVCDALPDLAAQVADGSLAYFGWATQMDRAQGHIDALKADGAGGVGDTGAD